MKINQENRCQSKRKYAAAFQPEDEEVEEFFAILRRIHVAVKYFEGRNGGRRELTARPRLVGFDGVVKSPDGSGAKRKPGLDLNSEPEPDVPDNSNTV
ncbi:Protein NIM1-INTERACTING 2 [Striga hermonthica]|uniref:Protein NIM1-INTERACTING 2 n=1 Tax=Striga hermonthica TaxID=68872 RepID=A0A9N7R7G5_STRHE|nr:Protein NIM1-INTERACTING 2 [Striga hermonthica]